MLAENAEPDLGTVCAFEVDTSSGPHGFVMVLRVVGEIDLRSVTTLDTALDAAMNGTPHDIVIDMSDVSFCSVHGVRILCNAAARMRAEGIGFALCGLNSHLDRIMTLVCPEERCVRYRAVSAAVSAACVDQTYRGR